jgi:hypothetical protein
MFRKHPGTFTNVAALVGGAAAAAVTLDPTFLLANTTLDASKLVATRTTSTADNSVRSSKIIPNTGAFCEVTLNALDVAIGVLDNTMTDNLVVGNNLISGGILTFNGSKFYNGSTSGLGYGGAINPVITMMLLYKPLVKVFHIFIPGFGWDTAGTGNPNTDADGQTFASIGGSCYFGASCATQNSQVTFNFGASAFSNGAQETTLRGLGFLPLKDA